MYYQQQHTRQLYTIVFVITLLSITSCKPKNVANAISGDAAAKTYVAPGSHDEFYNFVSGGFSGQMSVYGLPSGRLLRVIPVFSVDPEKGWGYSEETKPMLNTSHGFVPWDDLHHTELSQTKGEINGKWVFANANNTPRLARVDLKTFRTAEIIELPNSGGNHSSPFGTENSEYIVAGTRFSVPADGAGGDVPIGSYKENFKGHISFVSVDQNSGEMNIAFQLKTPGVNFDLARCGRAKSHGWFFFSCYNTEQANTLLEVNASQKDKDFIMAVNWKKAEEYIKAGKGQKMDVRYAHNKYDEATHTATSEIETEVLVLDVAELKDICYFIPCPKSPHGCDVDPTGEYIVGLLNALAHLLTGLVALVSGDPGIHRRVPVLGRHVRRDLELATALDEGLTVIALVGPDRSPLVLVAPTLQHGQRRLALGRAAGMGDLDIHDQPVAVLHEDVPHVAQARFVAPALLEQAGIGVRGAGVGVVAALLSF